MTTNNNNNNESSEADDKQRAQYKRIAMRMIKSIIKSMPSLAPSLKLDKKVLMVNNQVYMPLFSEYEGNIIPSYVVIKGDKERTLYFCVMKEILFDLIKEILVENIEIRDALTEQTINIQFACPDLNLGLYFTKQSKGFFKKKKTRIFQFNISDTENAE